MKLVDDLLEQEMLERIIERSKPRFPPSGGGLDFLLFTPFRYWPYPEGSRFRRAHQPEGCFYGATAAETAVAEAAFSRWLFYAESPAMVLPANALEHTAFSVPTKTDYALDLTAPPLDQESACWTHPTEYGPCQQLADAAREAGIQLIRYLSVRDPRGGVNLAILAPGAFAAKVPDSRQAWRIFVKRHAIQAFCEMPRSSLEFALSDWAGDPRVQHYLAGGAAKS